MEQALVGRSVLTPGGTTLSRSASASPMKIVFAASLAIASASLLMTVGTLQRLGCNEREGLVSAMIPAADSKTSKKMIPPLAKAVQNAPLGSLGPSDTDREHYRYYDTLFLTALQYEPAANSAIEVGCASDPFLKYLDWVDQRTCVAPYFADYGNNSTKDRSSSSVERITADFMRFDSGKDVKYDLLLCSQVLEHVPEPEPFMKKLIATARTSIVSVPYNWDPCGEKCNHVTDNISYEMLLEWSAPHKPIAQTIVTEDGPASSKGSRFVSRIILVFQNE